MFIQAENKKEKTAYTDSRERSSFSDKSHRKTISQLTFGRTNGTCKTYVASQKSKVFQRAVAANCTCPSIGTPMDVGSAIHRVIQYDYLNYGGAGIGNVRQVEQQVLTGHKPDLIVRDIETRNINQFGEIKPNTRIGEGRRQIGDVVNDRTNALGNGNQLNLNAWATGFKVSLDKVDPAADEDVNICLKQDVTERGLYLYDCKGKKKKKKRQRVRSTMPFVLPKDNTNQKDTPIDQLIDFNESTKPQISDAVAIIALSLGVGLALVPIIVAALSALKPFAVLVAAGLAVVVIIGILRAVGLESTLPESYS